MQDLERPLQQSECVMYFLLNNKIPITPGARNWSPGTWHQHLKGQSGIHIGVVPTVGAVMEYIDDSGRAMTAYVLNMDDNETIRYGTVGMYELGRYEEVEASAAAWHELRPVFINFQHHD